MRVPRRPIGGLDHGPGAPKRAGAHGPAGGPPGGQPHPAPGGVRQPGRRRRLPDPVSLKFSLSPTHIPTVRGFPCRTTGLAVPGTKNDRPPPIDLSLIHISEPTRRTPI